MNVALEEIYYTMKQQTSTHAVEMPYLEAQHN